MKTKQLTTGNHSIAWIDPNFRRYFSDSEFEKDLSTLYTKTLESPMNDSEIIAAFGSRESTLGNFVHALDTFSHNDFYIFYIRDASLRLWAVYAGWDSVDGGWVVEAGSVGRPDSWSAGCQVVSRDSFDILSSESSVTLTLKNLEARIRALEEWKAKVQDV